MLMDLETAREWLPLLIDGFWQTLALTVFTLVFGLLIALPVAWCRNARSPAARAFAYAFVFVFRGAPLLVLLFLIYYGVPELPVVRETVLWEAFREPLFCAVLALSLNSAGYLAEIVAGAVRGVPASEVEAATAAGLSRRGIVRHVVAPNALRIGLRAYGNEVTFVIKGTSVASLVTITDLMASANRIYYNTFDPITPLVAAGALYLVLVFALSQAVRLAEQRLSRGTVRRERVRRRVSAETLRAKSRRRTTVSSVFRNTSGCGTRWKRFTLPG